MTYMQAVAYLHGTLRLGSRPGLARIQALMDALEQPHANLLVIHIAGTSGKGSTAVILCEILMQAGYTVGLYLSPFVEDFRERIQINRQFLPRAEWAARVTSLANVIDRMTAQGAEHPTEFEILTALALQSFADHRCDFALLEVGLGGRLDSTNVVTRPTLSVITHIGMDHMEYLGDTLAQIAFEKCGIIKPGCPVVTSAGQPAEALTVIREQARQKDAPLVEADSQACSIVSLSREASRFSYKDETYTLSLPGEHQVQNALTALEAVEALRRQGTIISPPALREALAHVRFAGRLETVRTQPLCLTDGAHNVDKITALAKAVQTLYPEYKKIVVMGMSRDKEWTLCAPIMAACADIFIATQYQGARALDASRLAACATGHARRVETAESLSAACRLALALTDEHTLVLACGTLYMLGDAKRYLQEGAQTPPS